MSQNPYSSVWPRICYLVDASLELQTFLPQPPQYHCVHLTAILNHTGGGLALEDRFIGILSYKTYSSDTLPNQATPQHGHPHPQKAVPPTPSQIVPRGRRRIQILSPFPFKPPHVQFIWWHQLSCLILSKTDTSVGLG